MGVPRAARKIDMDSGLEQLSHVDGPGELVHADAAWLGADRQQPRGAGAAPGHARFARGPVDHRDRSA